ncbi:MAG: hypothetical protein LQ345_003142 [Seirophora villosa]|nr:MAG: hypothetical protein LQ345_003142 [Seirophora villosa]
MAIVARPLCGHLETRTKSVLQLAVQALTELSDLKALPLLIFPLDRLKMYTRIPSIDSRLDAASSRGSIMGLEASPLPKSRISAATSTLKASILRWAPLPVRGPKVAYPQRRKKDKRKLSPSDTTQLIGKWYKKEADPDRFWVNGESRGTCHFCNDCGENHERSKRKEGSQFGRANKQVRFQELDDFYYY